jgi:hypothetical protein
MLGSIPRSIAREIEVNERERKRKLLHARVGIEVDFKTEGTIVL